MSKGHWTSDEMIDLLYGLKKRDRHLEECEQCARQWKALLERHAQHAAAPSLPSEFLAAQRRSIYTRLGRVPQHAGRVLWAPAIAAAACVFAVVAFLAHPKPSPPPVDAADAQFLSEVYSMEQSAEPRAAEPIHALFEGGR